MTKLIDCSTKNSSSEEPLMLDADNKVLSLKLIKDTISALGFLHEIISKDNLSVGTRHNTLSLARYHLSDLENALGAKDDIEQEAELRKNLLRQANLDIRQLREQLGKGVTVEAIGNKLYQLDRTIYNWWKNLGFSYSKATLLPNYRGANFDVEFTVRIQRHISSFETKPVSAKAEVDAKAASLEHQLEIADSKHSVDGIVIDNPQNRLWITKKIREKFPNCRIVKWESHSSGDDLFEIRHVQVYIDINDVGEEIKEINPEY